MKFTLRLISITAAFVLFSFWLLEKLNMPLFQVSSDLKLILALVYMFTEMKYGHLRIGEQDKEIEKLRSELNKQK